MTLSSDPTSLRPARAAATLVLAAVLALAPSPVLSQGKEWWDLHDDAKKIIESDKSTEAQVESARRSLAQALKAKDGEGKFETYNPSVPIDYLPYFYLGWANLRLKRYDEAAKNFKRSDEIGFVRKNASLKSKLDNYQSLLSQLKPAADAVNAAKANALVNQCGTAAPKIKDAMSKIEAFLAAPSDASSASSLKGWIDSLNAGQSECAREVGGRVLAAAMDEFQKAREAVNVEGVADLLTPETQKDLESALAAGKDASGKGDDKGIKAAAEKLRGLSPRVARDVDARMASLAQEAEKLAKGNEAALNKQNGLGSKLGGLAAAARDQKAAGKTGKELAAVVKAGSDLRSLVATARSTVAPLLQAQGGALDTARRDYDSWASQHACEIPAVGLKETSAAAVKEAAAARQGESADAMDSAAAKLASIRRDVESKMKDALPKKQEEAKGALSNADALLANVADASQKSQGEGLKNGIQQALSKNDVCAIESAIEDLGRWVAKVAPKLEADRKQAIARNQPALTEGQRLLSGYGGILKPETVEGLKGPVDRLAGLVKSSYDTAAIDKSGLEVSSIVSRANTEISGQIQEGTKALRTMKSDARWAEVSPGRRLWLEQNLTALGQPNPDPAIIRRFAAEYPRARVEMALATAFAALYEQGDAAAAARTLEDLGPGLRAGSAALDVALSYFYWYQTQGASGSDRESLMGKAREAFDAGKTKGLDVASLGAQLFAPAFMEEMSRR